MDKTVLINIRKKNNNLCIHINRHYFFFFWRESIELAAKADKTITVQHFFFLKGVNVGLFAPKV